VDPGIATLRLVVESRSTFGVVSSGVTDRDGAVGGALVPDPLPVPLPVLLPVPLPAGPLPVLLPVPEPGFEGVEPVPLPLPLGGVALLGGAPPVPPAPCQVGVPVLASPQPTTSTAAVAQVAAR
jgi:hypothetical protein